MTPASRATWFVRRDIDGFFGLGLDNLIQFILIGTLCQGVLGMPAELVLSRIFPGAALSILFGNMFYAWQARRLAARTGRDDVTALPYGINTVTLIAYIFFIMRPVYQQTGSADLAWKVGLLACFLSGLIELAGALVAERIRRLTPRAALLSALAGIAMTFISMEFVFRIYQQPWIAMVPMVIILAQYFSQARYPFGVPGGLLAVLVGSVLFWAVAPQSALPPAINGSSGAFALAAPRLSATELWEVLKSEHLLRHLSIIVPMGLLNVVGSLQNIESAEASGDSYSTVTSLSVNGLGSLAASLFGSCFPTTIYIGHPGWKALGARAGYSTLSGVFVTVVCITGTMGWVIRHVPLESGIGILLWIGIIICAQAFQATPKHHAPAVAFGFFPCLAAWGGTLMESGLQAAGSSFHALQQGPQPAGLLPLHGILSLSQGFLFTSMILAALAVQLIEKDFLRAALWALVAAVCAWFGLIHAFEITPGGVLPAIGWGTARGYALNYLLVAAFFLGIHASRARGKPPASSPVDSNQDRALPREHEVPADSHLG
ncbi:MAG: NCS2 family permease [bacterium]